MSAEDNGELSFEEALSRLEAIVRELEAGRIKLDDAVNAYEQAVGLKNFCEKKLQEAKLKIEKIWTFFLKNAIFQASGNSSCGGNHGSAHPIR